MTYFHVIAIFALLLLAALMFLALAEPRLASIISAEHSDSLAVLFARC